MTTAEGSRRSDADQADQADEAIDRRGRDGDASASEMLGGLGAGAGDRLGPDLDDEDDLRAVAGNQHSFAAEEFQIDAGTNYHGVENPA